MRLNLPALCLCYKLPTIDVVEKVDFEYNRSEVAISLTVMSFRRHWFERRNIYL